MRAKRTLAALPRVGSPARSPATHAALGAAAALTAVGGYQLTLRPWHLSFGATDEEAGAVLPGDDLLPAPTVVSTRAISIAAPRERVWPWLVQLGKDRGGLYSYTLFENAFGLGIHNADRVVPELQNLAVGDRVPLSRKRFAVIVREIDPEGLVFEFADGGWIWGFSLIPDGGERTRLVIRNRWSSAYGSPARSVMFWLLEPAAFVMEQRMLRGIRQRAENTARQQRRRRVKHAVHRIRDAALGGREG